MAVVIASDLGKEIAARPLLRGVSFKLERRDRMTLSGRNGAGKTTLLRMLAGETTIDSGELVLGKGVKVSLHDQRPPSKTWASGDSDGAGGPFSLRDYVRSGASELLALERELAELEQRMAGGDYAEPTLARYADLQAALEHAGGYTWHQRAMTTLRGLGFEERDLDRPLGTLSGGELTRASLGRALAGEPDLLLLDEPTNHLDIASLEWLEAHLVALDAAVIVVAHDRWFLEAVGTSVLELEGGRARFFPGSWHQWRQEKAARELALGRAAERQQAEIARLERFVNRFRAGTRARQAQSRARQLQKLERGSRDRIASDHEAPVFAFKPPERSGRVVFELERGRITLADELLLDDGELWLERGEHVSLVGANGAGKTTLIEALVGKRELLEPDAGAPAPSARARPPVASDPGPAISGKLRTGHNVKVGYLSQHTEELAVKGARTVLEACQQATGLTPGKARALLARFLFSAEDADRPLELVSGGELRRLALAVLVDSGANVLVLDEPTNHLDIESREALEEALRQFQGSLLLISHDRALLDAVGTRTVAFEQPDGDGSARKGKAGARADRRPATLRSYVGGWPEYVRVRTQRDSEARQSPKPAAPKKARAV